MGEVAVFLCVLLWARSGRADALGLYEDRVLGLVAEHGGQVLQRAQVTDGADDDAPAEVQLLRFPSETALGSYLSDPRRTAMAEDRDTAIAKTDVHRVRLR
jgi:uncharacterized protein (DUF1330 family)